MKPARKIALVGNPNCGKSSLFNALTGLRQKVGNFPGVTVDRKTGHFTLKDGQEVTLIDLPGTYSLYPTAEDERVATHALTNTQSPDHPDLVVLVADATNLRRSLLLCTQVMDLGLPVILALNMADLLEKEGRSINVPLLSAELGVPVVVISALQGNGIAALCAAMASPPHPSKTFFHIPPAFDAQLKPVLERLGTTSRYRAWLEMADEALMSNEMVVRYDRIGAIVEAVEKAPTAASRLSDRLDRAFLHPVWGYVIFIVLLSLIFQSIFAWASYPMDWIDAGFTAAGKGMHRVFPEGWFSELLIDGVWAGLGGIVVFVPQIAMLFFFISILEDSGYMSRVVFLMDRLVRPFGFSGKSVIPLIGGMACAVPSIMMARNIPSRAERLITIMVTPLMSCSARIPVYVLLISMFVPDERFLGIFNLQGLVMTGMYFLGFFMALGVAWVIKAVGRLRSSGIFVTELPIYRLPRWGNVGLTMYHKSRTFVLEAGKVILLISVVLWFLKTYGPADRMAEISAAYQAKMEQAGTEAEKKELNNAQSAAKLQASFAGIIGRGMEPVIKPLGFDWKIGIALLSSFAAREVFVGTMATLYSAGEEAAEEDPSGSGGRFDGLRARMKAEVNPETGKQVYTAPVAFSLLIFYAFAMQCMSTLAVVRKETRSWRMTLVMLAYMTALAYTASFVLYQLTAA